jgi:hypothetical protein
MRRPPQTPTECIVTTPSWALVPDAHSLRFIRTSLSVPARALNDPCSSSINMYSARGDSCSAPRSPPARAQLLRAMVIIRICLGWWPIGQVSSFARRSAVRSSWPTAGERARSLCGARGAPRLGRSLCLRRCHQWQWPACVLPASINLPRLQTEQRGRGAPTADGRTDGQHATKREYKVKRMAAQ